MTHALILSGGGAFSDPWHPFAETSARVAEIARRLGWTVDLREDVEDASLDLNGVDVLIVNAADGPIGGAREAAHCSVERFLERGGSVFALHVGAATLLGWPGWESVTGMAWVNGTSMHPPLGPSQLLVPAGAVDLTDGIGDFELIDERYTALRLGTGLDAFVFHELDGERHPVVWRRRHGSSRIVVDTLGHDVRSFESAEHCLLVGRCLTWLAQSD